MERKTILSYERMPNSVNGNPRFRVVFDDGVIAKTMSDAMFAYAMGNPDMRGGSKVLVEYTRAGNIRRMAPRD